MKKKISRKWVGVAVVAAVGLVLAAPNFLSMAGILPSAASPGANLAGGRTGAAMAADGITATVQVRAADAVNSAIMSSGAIVFGSILPVVIDVDGTVTALPVEVGDAVEAGDLLVGVDTVTLERAAARARLDVAAAQNRLDQLRDPATAEEIAEAEANLASAQAKLDDVQQGPTATELAAARASLAAAQAKYGDVTEAMSDDETTKLKAGLEKARVNLEKAQRAYDQIKWAGDVGARPESANLQNATIEYEAAQAEYALAAEPASAGDVQSAVSSIRRAQSELDDLLRQPNAADIASAEAQVAGAQSQLDTLRGGADELEIRASEIQLEQALVSLEEALVKLRSAEVSAPAAGVVTSIETAVGETVRAGNVVGTLADPQDLAVEVLIAEVDVANIAAGQPATISLDAFPGRSIEAAVERIAPTHAAGGGAVNYQVDIRLTGTDLAGVRPGMTAVATLGNGRKTGGWLVPANAIQTKDGRTVATVVRDGGLVDVAVQPGSLQGEWQLVTAPALRAGDQVVGSVTSRLDTGEDFVGGGGFPPRPSQLAP